MGMSHVERRVSLTRGLRDDGHTVVVADDGFHLIQLMSGAILDESGTAATRPDLIIADVTMAGCSGMTILQGIRQLNWGTPVFLIVDFNHPETARAAFENGADRVFEKPIEVTEVRSAANVILLADGRPPRRAAGRP